MHCNTSMPDTVTISLCIVSAISHLGVSREFSTLYMLNNDPQSVISATGTRSIHTSSPFQSKVPRQSLSREQWENLKDLISRLYVDENKTFRKIATILLEAHGFEPTKGQLSTRRRSWGFKKNASRKERFAILQSPGARNVVGTHGKVVNQTTRARWELEFSKGAH